MTLPRLGQHQNTGKGSIMTMPIPALWDALCRSPKHCISATQLAELRKRMVGYYEEEHLWNLQEEQELQDALANTKCNTETASESSTQTAQDSIDVGTLLRLVAMRPIMVPPPSGFRQWPAVRTI
jgi:hypothetical protein